MSDEASLQQQQLRQKEFMSLLPLTIELSGLSRVEIGRFLTPEQMELRANTLRNAYKIARQLLLDLGK